MAISRARQLGHRRVDYKLAQPCNAVSACAVCWTAWLASPGYFCGVDTSAPVVSPNTFNFFQFREIYRCVVGLIDRVALFMVCQMSRRQQTPQVSEVISFIGPTQLQQYSIHLPRCQNQGELEGIACMSIGKTLWDERCSLNVREMYWEVSVWPFIAVPRPLWFAHWLKLPLQLWNWDSVYLLLFWDITLRNYFTLNKMIRVLGNLEMKPDLEFSSRGDCSLCV